MLLFELVGLKMYIYLFIKKTLLLKERQERMTRGNHSHRFLVFHANRWFFVIQYKSDTLLLLFTKKAKRAICCLKNLQFSVKCTNVFKSLTINHMSVQLTVEYVTKYAVILILGEVMIRFSLSYYISFYAFWYY